MEEKYFSLTFLTIMPSMPVQDPSGSFVPKVLSGDNTYVYLGVVKICWNKEVPPPPPKKSLDKWVLIN